ncbi:MAG: hypothetical protein ACRCYY_17495 [Trueperaceae bacterium]
MFKTTKETSWLVIIVFVVAQALLSIFWNWCFENDIPFTNTLSVNLANILLIVGGLFFLVTHLRPKDVGLDSSKLLSGITFKFLHTKFAGSSPLQWAKALC